ARLLLALEPRHGAFDVVFVGTDLFRMTGAEERQQRQTGHGRVCLLARTVLHDIPVAVVFLMVGQPLQSQFDAFFRRAGTAVTLDHQAAAATVAVSEAAVTGTIVDART